METVKEWSKYLLTTVIWFFLVAGFGLFSKVTSIIFMLGWNTL